MLGTPVVEILDPSAGIARIGGVAVDDIARMHEIKGISIDDVAAQYGLTRHQVFAALSYFSSHEQVIRARIDQGQSAGVSGEPSRGTADHPLQALLDLLMSEPLPEESYHNGYYEIIKNAQKITDIIACNIPIFSLLETRATYAGPADDLSWLDEIDFPDSCYWLGDYAWDEAGTVECGLILVYIREGWETVKDFYYTSAKQK